MIGVSLVVPVQDEAASIAALVQSIRGLSLIPDEIVFVDAGSRDRTVERIRREAEGLPVRILAAGRVFPGVARNLGVAETSREWIAFTDAGVTLEPDWLSELASRASGCDAVLGRVDPVCDSLFHACSAIAYVPRLRSDGTRGASSASFLVRRTVFDRCGGFPAFRAAEDLVFFDRLGGSGAVIASAPRALAHWQIADSPAAVFRRFALYSKHNLIAGWESHWHYGLARLYALLALATAALGATAGAAWALSLPPLFFLARSARAAWQKRLSFSFSTLNPLRIVGAAWVLVIIDAATLVGVLRWLDEGRRRAS